LGGRRKERSECRLWWELCWAVLLADFGVVGFEYHLREVKKLFTVDIATAVDFDAGKDEDD